MSYRILVTEAMSEDGPDWLRANGYEVKYGRGTDEKTLIEDLQDCDGVIPRLAVMSDAVISACPRLKVIARHGSGVDTVDLESCRRHGVRVVNTRGSNSVAVAEHAMLLVLACAKTLNVLRDRYRAGQFKEARKLAAASCSASFGNALCFHRCFSLPNSVYYGKGGCRTAVIAARHFPSQIVALCK